MWAQLLAIVALAAPVFHAPPGSALQVLVAQVYQGAVVPDVIGRTQQNAESIIRDAKLVVGQVVNETSRTRKPGTVISQRPIPGTKVRVGSPVELTVAIAVLKEPLVAVPSLSGLTPEQALDRLARHGLTGRGVLMKDDAHVGRIAMQKPLAGERIPRRAEVLFWYGAPVSHDDVPSAVPDLRKRRLADASRVLESAGLKLGTREDPGHFGMSGIVVAQSPSPNQLVPRGSLVRIRLGAPQMTVPEVRGQFLSTAEEIIRGHGLWAGTTRNIPSDAPRGTVISQDPRAGALVDSGTSIALEVAVDRAKPPVSTPPSQPITNLPQTPDTPPGLPPRAGADSLFVPNVLDLTLDVGRTVLDRSGLVLTRVDTSRREDAQGLIAEQHPHAGTRVPLGAAQSLTVAVLPRAIVPGVIGQNLTSAKGAIERAHLQRGAVTEVPSPGQPGLVIAQVPTSGTEVERGSAVALTVTKAIVVPAPSTSLTVPSLVGLTEQQAAESLGRTNLALGLVTWSTEPSEHGKVVVQVPEAGARARAGDSVRVTLAGPAPPPEARTPQVVTDSTPTEAPGGSSPWPLIAVGVVVLGALARLIGRLITGRKPPAPGPTTPSPPTTPVIWFEPHPAVGKNSISSDTEPVTRHEVHLTPHAGAATERVETDETFTRELP